MWSVAAFMSSTCDFMLERSFSALHYFRLKKRTREMVKKNKLFSINCVKSGD